MNYRFFSGIQLVFCLSAAQSESTDMKGRIRADYDCKVTLSYNGFGTGFYILSKIPQAKVIWRPQPR